MARLKRVKQGFRKTGKLIVKHQRKARVHVKEVDKYVSRMKPVAQTVEGASEGFFTGLIGTTANYPMPRKRKRKKKRKKRK